MGLVDIANEELKRGIEEQATRHSGRLVLVGLLSAAATTVTAQVLATNAGDHGARLALGLLTVLAIAATIGVWFTFTCYDIDPRLRLVDAKAAGMKEAALLDDLVAGRMASYKRNDLQLQSKQWYLATYGACALNVLVVIWGLLMVVGKTGA